MKVPKRLHLGMGQPDPKNGRAILEGLKHISESLEKLSFFPEYHTIVHDENCDEGYLEHPELGMHFEGFLKEFPYLCGTAS